MAAVADLRLRVSSPGLLGLPWQRPLAQWRDDEADLRELPVGPSRHLVRFVHADDELWASAMAYAAKLTERSRQGLAEMKRLAREGLALDPRQAMRLEADAAARHILGPDTAEGLAAFQARRKPNFA